MWAVFKKEWLGNFRTLTGWIFLAVTIFFLGWYFNYFGLNSGLPYARSRYTNKPASSMTACA